MLLFPAFATASAFIRAAGACVVLACTMSAASARAQQILPADALAVNLVEISDPHGFERPMVAARALIPEGWLTQGGVRWNMAPAGCGAPANFVWSTTSPDGQSAFELVPTDLWQASNAGAAQCRFGAFENIQSYLAAYVSGRYPRARIGAYKSRPDFLDLQRSSLDAQLALVNNAGIGARAWADAGELSFTYRDKNKDYEGVIAATGKFFVTQVYNPLGGPPLTTLTAETNSAFAATGPKGKFDRRTAEAIRKSLKPDTAWASKYFDLHLRLAGMQTQAVKDRAAIIVAAGAAMTASTVAANKAAGERAVKNSYADPMPSWKAGQESDDRIQRERIEGVRGVETYEDPVYGGTVQLDAAYDHAWRVNNADSYILTNDPNFNPGLYSIDAQQLKPAR